MYNVEIKKDEILDNEAIDNGTYYFTLTKLYSALDPSIKTNIFNEFEKYGVTLPTIAEDLLTIALSVYALDKRFLRSDSADAWTRDFHVVIPVCEIDKWLEVKSEVDEMLCFLSGDRWNVEFVATDRRIVHSFQQTESCISRDFDCISLFSGGLDSFCGAINFLENNKKVLFVGNEEYPKLKERQEYLIDILSRNYNRENFDIKTFTAQVQMYYTIDGKKFQSTENTTRTRSLLFIAAAIAFSTVMTNSEIPVYIPENGFIGLNLPITPSRMGTCSTRTTHPKFLRMLNTVITSVGFSTKVENPFKYLSKSAVVRAVENTNAFNQGAMYTISCSHPIIGRYVRGGTYPNNCGYCYPCLIRKSSLSHLNINETYTYDFNASYFNMRLGKQDDIRSMLFAARQYKLYGRDYVLKRIISEGNLEPDEVAQFTDLYVETMEDFIATILNQDLRNYAGI